MSAAEAREGAPPAREAEGRLSPAPPPAAREDGGRDSPRAEPDATPSEPRDPPSDAEEVAAGEAADGDEGRAPDQMEEEEEASEVLSGVENDFAPAAAYEPGSAENSAEDHSVPIDQDDGLEKKTETDARSVDGSAAAIAPDGLEEKSWAERDRERKRALKELQQAEKLELQRKQALGAKDRIAYLMRQTDIFAHFVKAPADLRDSSTSDENGSRGRKGKGRMSEKQEDELLLKESDSKTEGTRLLVQPKCIPTEVGTMRDYQLEGLNWMIKLYDNGINGILADEMGLGKTLQTISLLGYLKEARGVSGPHIVIVPKTTVSNWYNEVTRWCPSLVAFKFHGDKNTRAELKSQYLDGETPFDVCITTYEMVIAEKAALTKLTWRYLIIDEAHRIKNEQGVLSKVVRLFATQYRLLISGTPLQNNLHELWAMLNFLLPDIFSESSTFDEWFNVDGQSNDIFIQLHKILRPFLLRRLKSDVEKSLPPKREVKLLIGMSPMQKTWYSSILSKNIDVLNSITANRTRMLNILMQLRKCANHPYLFEGAEQPPFINDYRLVENAGKMVLLDKLLIKLKAGGNRVLIFSQMTRMLDILEDYCWYRNWEYCRIDGSTTGDDRDAAMETFNRPDSTKFLFMLSTRAGGLGINLATADTVILYDSDWNPQMDLQAMDRAHRIGQTKPVNVYRFMTEGSVEELIIARAQKKLYLDAAVIQQGRLAEQSKSLSKEEMLGMIRFGADEIFRPQGQLSDEDIDVLIARGEERTEKDNACLKQSANTLANFSLSGEEKSLYQYGGQDYKGIDGGSSTPFSVSLPKRNPGNKTYDENEYYRNALTGGKEREKGSRMPKQFQSHDFQFFDNEQLEELRAKELRYFEYKRSLGRRADGTEDDATPLAVVPPLSPEEEELKEQLLSQGFASWTRKDFNAFVRGCELFGRHDLVNVTREVEGKSEKEVVKYAIVFFKRFRELKDWEKIMRRIEQGELKIQRRNEIANTLSKKVSRTKNPWVQLRINYGSATARGKQFTEENDRFLVCMTNQLGYGRWDELHAEVRQSWVFRFDWFFKTRTVSELARRVDVLARLIEKEIEEEESEEMADARPKKAKLMARPGFKRPIEEGATPPPSKKRK